MPKRKEFVYPSDFGQLDLPPPELGSISTMVADLQEQADRMGNGVYSASEGNVQIVYLRSPNPTSDEIRVCKVEKVARCMTPPTVTKSQLRKEMRSIIER